METTVAPRRSNQPKREERAVRRRSERLLDLLASWPVFAVSGVVLVVFAYVFFASSAPFSIPTVDEVCGAAPLDMRPYSSADDIAQFLDGCGAAGRDAYRSLQIADLFYPAVSGLFLASSLALTLERLFPRHPRMRGLAAIALLGTGLDYVENLFAWRAIAAYPGRAATNGLLGVASAAKTTTLWLAGVMLIAGIAVLVVRGLVRRIVSTSNRSPASVSH